MKHRSDAQGFSAHPLAWLAGAFAPGVLVALSAVVPIQVPVIAGFASTLAVVVTLLWNKLNVATMLSLVSVFLLGVTLASIERHNVPPNQLKLLIENGAIAIGAPVEITGVLAREPEPAPDRVYLHLQVDMVRTRTLQQRTSGVVVVLVPFNRPNAHELEALDLRYGARIRLMTMLERADDFRNPGVSSFTEYLDRKGYDATGFVKSPLLIERLDDARAVPPLAWLYGWRRKLQREIHQRFSKETAGVLDAALLGNRYFLSRQASEKFREGGTFHVLVISGLHITFLGGLVFFVTRRFTRSKILQFLFSIVVVWGYSIAVGAESSVVRAALMFTLILIGPLVSRRASSLNAFGAAALFLLVWRPTDLLDPSFQLTFASVLAILIFAWPLLQKMAEVGSWRPTRESPYPPAGPPWLKTFSECLFWSERHSRKELDRTNYSYKLFKTPWAATLERWHLQRAMRYAFSALIVSAAVQLTLAPFLVVYFHRLSFASLALNIGISLVMAGVALAAGVGLLMAQFSSTLAAPFITLADGLNWLMVHSVDPFSRLGVSSVRLPDYSGWAMAIYGLYFVPLTKLATSLSRWLPLELPGSRSKTLQRDAKFATAIRIAIGAQVFAAALIVFHPGSAGKHDGRLSVDFLDVGQGDAALVTFPDNTTLLIDAGGRPGPFSQQKLLDEGLNTVFERDNRSIGEAVVSEYLWWKGLDHIDYLLATHADADHIDGFNDVARNFSVRAALVARSPGKDPDYLKFSETLAARGIPIRLIGAGDQLQFGGATASVLWPRVNTSPDVPSHNNDSIVLRLQFGEHSILLTGDIEAAPENALVRAGENLRADIVKVAHHGSRTSSTERFVASTRPRFAVVSVGQTSIFGHPHREVLERWQAAGARVLTTGRSGTITFSTDGRNLELKTFLEN